LKQSFWQELRVFEGERQMPYITSVEEIGFERGMERGVERERSLILRQLNRKVGSLPPQILEQVNGLSIEKLEVLGEALLDFEAIADLTQWLEG
jgi:predicted transposase YdaD